MKKALAFRILIGLIFSLTVLSYRPLAGPLLAAGFILASTIKRMIDEAWESLDAWHDDLYMREQAITRAKGATRGEFRHLQKFVENTEEW